MLLFENLIIWYINPADIDTFRNGFRNTPLLFDANIPNVYFIHTHSLVFNWISQCIFMFPDMSSLNTAKAIAIKFSELNGLVILVVGCWFDINDDGNGNGDGAQVISLGVFAWKTFSWENTFSTFLSNQIQYLIIEECAVAKGVYWDCWLHLSNWLIIFFNYPIFYKIVETQQQKKTKNTDRRQWVKLEKNKKKAAPMSRMNEKLTE